MALKETKRKGFNFFRSYYDVYNELPDKDKIAFIDALLDRQFLGIKPTELKGMANFAWISQVNSIDSQVKGYEDKTKTKLNPTVGVKKNLINPTEQVQVQVQEKEKEKEEVKQEAFDFFWNLYDKKIGDKEKVFKKWCKLSNEEKEAIQNYIPKYKISQPEKRYRKNPETFLNNKGWNDEIIIENNSKSTFVAPVITDPRLM